MDFDKINHYHFDKNPRSGRGWWSDPNHLAGEVSRLRDELTGSAMAGIESAAKTAVRFNVGAGEFEGPRHQIAEALLRALHKVADSENHPQVKAALDELDADIFSVFPEE